MACHVFVYVCMLSLYMCIILFSRAASHASGPSYYYLTGAAAMLEIGLIQYAMQKAVSKVCVMYGSYCTCVCVCV